MRKYTNRQPVKGTALPTHSAKRMCASPGCPTRLSIYNGSEYCWLHDGPTPAPEEHERVEGLDGDQGGLRPGASC
jgi:hypothetical protein